MGIDNPIPQTRLQHCRVGLVEVMLLDAAAKANHSSIDASTGFRTHNDIAARGLTALSVVAHPIAAHQKKKIKKILVGGAFAVIPPCPVCVHRSRCDQVHRPSLPIRSAKNTRKKIMGGGGLGLTCRVGQKAASEPPEWEQY